MELKIETGLDVVWMILFAVCVLQVVIWCYQLLTKGAGDEYNPLPTPHPRNQSVAPSDSDRPTTKST